LCEPLVCQPLACRSINEAIKERQSVVLDVSFVQPEGKFVGSALLWYCAGLLGTVVAFIFSYLVQLQLQLRLLQEELARYAGATPGRFKHQWLLWSAIFVVLASAISFGMGCWKAASALGAW
jgi:hypothetical protein